MRICKRLNCALAVLLLSGNMMCSDVNAFEYEWITKGQDIDEVAKESLQNVEKYMNSKDKNKYRESVKTLQPYILKKGSFNSRYDFRKESKYAILYHFSLACYLGGLKLTNGLSYSTLDEIIGDKDNSPWVKQMQCLSCLLKGLNMARIFSLPKNRDASNLKIAESLLRPFIASDKSKTLLQNYLALLDTTDQNSLAKFQTILGKSRNYTEICKKIDAYARYYLGVVLFCLSFAQEVDTAEVVSILNPIENSPFLSVDRQNLIKVITAAFAGRKESQNTAGSEASAVSFTSDEIESVLNLSDADLESIVTMGGYNSKDDSVQSEAPRPLTPPSRPAPPIPNAAANPRVSSSSSGSIPPPPPVSSPVTAPQSATTSSSESAPTTATSSRPPMNGNLLLEIQQGFKLKKVANPDSDTEKAKRKEKAQNSTPQGAMMGELDKRLAQIRKATGGGDDSDSDESELDFE